MALQPTVAAVLPGSKKSWDDAGELAKKHGYVIANHDGSWFFEPHPDNKDFQGASLKEFWFNNTNYRSHIHIHLDQKQLGITGGTASMHCGSAVNAFSIRPPLAHFLSADQYTELTYETMPQALVSMVAYTLANSHTWIDKVVGLQEKYKDEYRSLWDPTKKTSTGKGQLTAKGQLYVQQWTQLLTVWRDVVCAVAGNNTWRYPVSLGAGDAKWLKHV
ncbi:hypothetical protein AMS68_005558 [Peltaster fructicola]|uniref:Uncharacterized protein n=1 Tax=Peltaster fructicola TaxID=286661 RepID=A0A6H0XZE3_9PEZI|nr:hypothetical protein AMS68_005558 [Peltaster fructicola]